MPITAGEKSHPHAYKIARAIEVMEYEMSTPNNDYWWWSDGLYMVMPVMTKLYNITHNPLYLTKLYEYWSYANSIMYDTETGLYYRDAKYVYPKHKSVNGKKISGLVEMVGCWQLLPKFWPICQKMISTAMNTSNSIKSKPQL